MPAKLGGTVEVYGTAIRRSGGYEGVEGEKRLLPAAASSSSSLRIRIRLPGAMGKTTEQSVETRRQTLGSPDNLLIALSGSCIVVGSLVGKSSDWSGIRFDSRVHIIIRRHGECGKL